MAQAARELTAKPDIDYHLDYQFAAWAGVPEHAEWWSGLDPSQREASHLEWVGITERRLLQLARWATAGLLTPAQRARYNDLLALVAEQRPTIDRLLAE